MKTVIVTGATGAMGFAATTELLRRGYQVVAACRNTARMQQLALQLPEGVRHNLVVLPLELASSQSIDEFAHTMAQRGTPIFALWNNAGTLQRRYGVNDEGIELTYAVNFLGTRRLSEALLPLMERGGVVLFTSSLSCYVASRRRMERLPLEAEDFRQVRAYADSKLALTLYAQRLATEHPELRINCTDPGIVDSALLRMERWFDPLCDWLFRPLCKRPEQGIVPALRALESPLSGHLFRGKKRCEYGRGHLPYPKRFLI